MTQFEYFSVAVSIILALGIGRLLDGIFPAFQPDRRYWVHVGWVVQKLGNHVLWWWGTWGGRNLEQWNLAWFIWTLIGPGILYLQATLLVPKPLPTRPWREQFFLVRRWFFAGNLAICVILLVPPVLLLDDANAALALGIAALAAIAIVGVSTSNPRIHAALVIAALAVQYVGIAAAIFLPE